MVLEPARGIVGVEAHAHNAGTDGAPDIGISPDIHDRRSVVLMPTPQDEPLGLHPLGKPSRLLLRFVLAMPAHRTSRPMKVPPHAAREWSSSLLAANGSGGLVVVVASAPGAREAPP